MGVVFGHCQKLSDNWDVTSPRLEACQGSSAVTISLFVCHMISDIVILVIPVLVIVSIWEVGLSVPRKLFIGAMLCSGIFTMVAAIIVFIMFLNVSDPASIANGARWARREQLIWVLLLSAPSIVSIFKGRILSKNTTTYGSMLGAEDKDEKSPRKGTSCIAELP
ncbi:hypothetical protein BP5796_09591 [Coleophoma crateriformis]|uniref:Rhodopsin domain-containing protein n=1 Tax=Coleophoma crateriformis TaxID=565419 RepID=A0A3D8QYG2_9HELO|nr:hypothetical protein BP5796_09591 [Coleophoma crateriformis]